ncbi:MAG: [FeFe] hydrogenase H-cluster maturation GTPase HydF [Ruminococcaceae bacterium]|nr:[FeFe] hydrogenase H-cluster maturation GTPase HydF [Oscillospiraceae bacterium]
MGLNSTPSSERIHIGFFGVRNAGKSSLVNRITNQDVSVVSDVKGTTTDAVKKSMELLPLGAVEIIDTPGIDDEGELGEKRVQSANKILNMCDIAVLVSEAQRELNTAENELIAIFKKRNIPYLIALNKSDLSKKINNADNSVIVSAKDNTGIEELKEAISKALGTAKKEIKLVGDFIVENDVVILVTPIDESAPKGRMILPQQQAIRDIIDSNAICVVIQPEQLEETLNKIKPALVITDSQVFKKVMNIVPESIPLTSFSILLARYKGFLDTAVNGAFKIDDLKDGAKILISEGCTHHRQCEDIGTVKLPKWLEAYTVKEFNFEFSSGHGFPEDLSEYDFILHCGGCMLGDKEMLYRMNLANEQGIPFSNYGTVIAYINGILERSIEITKDRR